MIFLFDFISKVKRFNISVGKDSDIEVQGELQLSSGKWILGRSCGYWYGMYLAAHTVLALTLEFYFLQNALKGHVLTVHLLVSDGNVLMKCNYHNQFAFFAI